MAPPSIHEHVGYVTRAADPADRRRVTMLAFMRAADEEIARTRRQGIRHATRRPRPEQP